MPKYRVVLPFACFVAVVLDADSEDAAIETAHDEGYIASFCGNGGSDKLIGVYPSDNADAETIAGGSCTRNSGCIY